jgi:hypothetical protein
MDLVDEIAGLDSEKDESLKDDSSRDESPKNEKDESSKDEDDDKSSDNGDEDQSSDSGDGDESSGEEGDESSGEEGDESSEDRISRLISEIDRLSGLTGKEEAIEKEEKKVDEEKKPLEADGLYDFIKEVDMDDVASDPKVFNKILDEVIRVTQQRTTEQVLKSIPHVVMSQVQQQSYLKSTSDKFYEDNPDLVNVRQVVRACAQQVQKEKPEWEVDKIFKETAKRTRQTLGMSEKIAGGGKKIPSVDDAAFARSSGGHKSNLKQKRSSLQMEIDEL